MNEAENEHTVYVRVKENDAISNTLSSGNYRYLSSAEKWKSSSHNIVLNLAYMFVILFRHLQ